jgi:hypothetical protein
MFRRPSSGQSGQVLIIFAFAFIAIIIMLALLFDGARGLVLRRQLQDASDAAALAGANVIQGLSPQQCSATAGPPPGAPVAAVTAAAKASVAANMPNYPQANVIVTCVAGYDNYAVKVRLGMQSDTFFGSIFGGGPLDVATDSSAVNGNTNINAYSVVMLDPMHLAWPNGQRGCPSFLLSGGPTVIFDSSIYVDSACLAADGGAMSTNGNSASLTEGAGAVIRIVGEYKPQALVISPTPLNYQPVKPDPLAWLAPPPTYVGAPPVGALKVQSNNKLIIGQGNSSSTVILEPGVYTGGIQLKNQSIAYLHPGIYVMNGGGFNLGAGQKVYALPANKNTTTDATWATDCLSTNCGILLYNTGTSGNGTTAMGQVTIGAQSTFKVRSYNPTFDTTKLANGTAYHNDNYKNLLIWQSGAPVPTSSYSQPILALTGGGNVFMAGTVYSPSAKIQMGGNSGGSGGDSVDLTLQFISWDLELYGNSSFHFRYNAAQFARLLDYGLIE